MPGAEAQPFRGFWQPLFIGTFPFMWVDLLKHPAGHLARSRASTRLLLHCCLHLFADSGHRDWSTKIQANLCQSLRGQFSCLSSTAQRSCGVLCRVIARSSQFGNSSPEGNWHMHTPYACGLLICLLPREVQIICWKCSSPRFNTFT